MPLHESCKHLHTQTALSSSANAALCLANPDLGQLLQELAVLTSCGHDRILLYHAALRKGLHANTITGGSTWCKRRCKVHSGHHHAWSVSTQEGLVTQVCALLQHAHQRLF